MKRPTYYLLLGLCWLAVPLSAAEPERLDFARDVRPILESSCWKCHGLEKQKGGVRFDRRQDALGKGDSGEKAIAPGKANESALIQRVEAVDAEVRMPPKGDPLSRDKIEILRRWIDEGARWPESEQSNAQVRREMVVTAEDRQHWSYRPLRVVEPPAVIGTSWCRTPVDRFILAALENRGLQPNSTADRRTLYRRLSFDLIGLPPAPDEIEAFVADQSSVAYEKLVDRLLSSSHYGERWGRHWLDVARYADSDGMESDADRPTAHNFRDFVIRAFNDDLSYQTFVRWQLAGDEYEPDNPRALAATGFLAAAPTEPGLPDMEEEKLRLRFNELDDMAGTTASAFLGLTLACARCHDHKFDAIPTRDYYRLQCAFTTTARDEVFLATRAEVSQYRELDAQWNKRRKAAENALTVWLSEQKSPKLAALQNAKIDALAISKEEKATLTEKPDSDAGKKLAAKHRKAIALADDDYRQGFNDDQRRRWENLKNERDAAQRNQPTRPPTALAIIDKKPEPEPTWLLERGDFYAKKERLQVGFLTVLTGRRVPEDYWAAARREVPPGRSTGQRRALADWLTDVDHGAGALLARVIVNRVWQHHFGEGLVRTPGDFGVRGERPTHPELLDWLARQFVAGGWRLKSLHRLILTSAIYQETMAFDAARSAIDPDNRLHWRRRPQRLEAEILRDAVLSVSGTLNTAQFGPAFKPPIPAEAMLARNTKSPYPLDARDTPATRRRTVYMFHKRVVQHPLMQAFDGPDAAVSCGRRSNTTVAPQALALLNDTFLRDRAADFARRLLAESGPKPADCINRAYWLALARPPTELERKNSLRFVDHQLERRAREKSLSVDELRLRALTDYCQVLFSLNEFIYVD